MPTRIVSLPLPSFRNDDAFPIQPRTHKACAECARNLLQQAPVVRFLVRPGKRVGAPPLLHGLLRASASNQRSSRPSSSENAARQRVWIVAGCVDDGQLTNRKHPVRLDVFAIEGEHLRYCSRASCCRF